MMFNELSGRTVPVRDQSGILSPDRVDLGPLNTLVLSDLHLGEDLAPTATEATRLHVDIVERQLVQFLRHYTRRREDGRPWRQNQKMSSTASRTITAPPTIGARPRVTGRGGG